MLPKSGSVSDSGIGATPLHPCILGPCGFPQDFDAPNLLKSATFQSLDRLLIEDSVPRCGSLSGRARSAILHVRAVPDLGGRDESLPGSETCGG